MKSCDIESLAFFGGEAHFSTPLHAGQLNLPTWDHFEQTFRDIFSRQYYTNHGVLAQQLEDRLADFLGVPHVVTMTNGTIALMLAAKALNLTGKVIVPAFTFPATVQSLTWAGAEPLFCDVDPQTHMLTPELVAPLLNDMDVSAILPVHLWGNLCATEALEELALAKGAHIYYDASHAFGCTRNGKKAGCHGILEICSFHASNVFSTGEGGCVCTHDGDIAERLRNLRSSYGRRIRVDVPINAYGRFSEAQAAMGLLSLDDYPSIVAANRARFETYTELLRNTPGIRILQPASGEQFTYQYVVLEVESQAFGLTRDHLAQLLRAENIPARRPFVPGMHRSPPYSERDPHFVDALPNTNMLCQSVMQLNTGQPFSLQDVRDICDLIISIHDNADSLCERLSEDL